MDWLLVVWIVGAVGTWWWLYWDVLEGGRAECVDRRVILLLALWLPFWLLAGAATAAERLLKDR